MIYGYRGTALCRPLFCLDKNGAGRTHAGFSLQPSSCLLPASARRLRAYESSPEGVTKLPVRSQRLYEIIVAPSREMIQKGTHGFFRLAG